MSTDIIKILVVDDSILELDMLSHSLGRAGFEVTTMSDAEGIIAMAETIKPTFILLDLFMPKASGIEICRQLKSEPSTAKIPIMFITASTDVDDAITGMHLGVIDYFHKPVDMGGLITAIKNHNIIQKLDSVWAPAREELTRVMNKYS
jgi:DNA-binding response OmpR family regulator